MEPIFTFIANRKRAISIFTFFIGIIYITFLSSKPTPFKGYTIIMLHTIRQQYSVNSINGYIFLHTSIEYTIR